jgi:hydrogenase maturation protease
MSAHIVLNTDTGAFISAQEPDARWDTLAAQCRNILTYPILVDESNTTVLASPIILYDYPKIDPRSTGDLFDCSEIEEALLLHIAVLSDDEKQRIAQSDDKLRAMLQRVEMVTPEEILRLHGGMRGRDRDEG